MCLVGYRFSLSCTHLDGFDDDMEIGNGDDEEEDEDDIEYEYDEGKLVLCTY